MPPLSRWILLVRKDDASCHLRRRQGAQHSSEPACAAHSHFFSDYRAEQPASTEDEWWRTGKHGIHSSSGDKEGPYLIHLADVANRFMPTAAGACSRAARTTITFFRMSIALPVVPLERFGVSKYITTRCGGTHTHKHNS